MISPKKIDFAKFKPLPIGKSDWASFSQSNYTVDKTLLIKDLIDDDTGVALFTRPRRFGKTTALQMIKAAESETDDLKSLAREACNQIETKQYAAEMSAQGLTDVLKLGLAFYKKSVELAK